MRVSILTYIFPVVAICVLLIVLASSISNTEPFEVPAPAKPILASCPKGSHIFITKKGDMDCCANEPDGSNCSSVTCTLSPQHDSIKTCISMLQARFKESEERYCTKDKPHYFETQEISGCMKGERMSDGSPREDAEICRFYENQIENYSKQDSCAMEKAKENFKCPWENATISVEDGTPSVIVCKAITDNGIKQCNEDKTFLNYLDNTVPNWRMTFDSSQKSQFCSIIVSSMAEGREPATYEWPI